MWELHRRIGGDIPGTFAELQRAGHIEIITCAATHGYLPLLSRDESIHLQLRTAVETHRRHFGRAPRGIWLPECAYRPRYEWTPPDRAATAAATGACGPASRRCWPRTASSTSSPTPTWWRPASRSSSTATTSRCASSSATDRRPPLPVSAPRSPYAPYRVASRGGTGSAVAFFRDPRTTLQVWSREHGYPGEYAYLEFHKKHFPGGLRFWRITDTPGDLGSKQVYDPERRRREGRAAGHATSSSWCRRRWSTRAGGGPAAGVLALRLRAVRPLVVRGPALARARRRVRWPRNGVQPDDARRGARGGAARRRPLSLPEGSWGEGGDHRVWLNRDTEWTWDRVYSAEARVGRAAPARGDGGHPELKRVLAQATRELLLLQASDWQFLITTGAARDYAERRVAEHYAEFKRLSEMARHAARRRSRCRPRRPSTLQPARARGLRLPRPRPVLGRRRHREA